MGRNPVRSKAFGAALAALLAAPVLLALVALPGTSQTNILTCETNASTDKPFPNLNATRIDVKSGAPGVVVTTSGVWTLVNGPGAVLLEVTVRNSGTANAGSFVVRLEDIRPDGVTVNLGERTVTSLNAGQSTTPPLRYLVPAYNGTGEHVLRATVDTANSVNETCTPTPTGTAVNRENDNVLRRKVLHTAQPDLRVTALVAKAETKSFTTASATSKIAFNATLSNAGTHRAFNMEAFGTGFTAVFALNGDEAKCRHPANSVTVRQLDAGATRGVEVKCELAGLTGDFNVSVSVDAARKVAESNEANNRFVRVFQLRIADLVANVTGVTGVSPDNAVPEFGALSLTATVRNAGNANATTDAGGNFTWHVFLDQKANTPQNRLSPSGGFTTKLAPGAAVQAAFRISPIERNLAPGSHRIFVVADSNAAGDTTQGTVIESNSTNNEFVFRFLVADFRHNLTAATLAKTLSPGIDAAFPFNLTNEGNANDTVAFNLTGAAVASRVELPNGTAVVGEVTVAANATRAFVLKVPIPREAAEGARLNVTVRSASTVPLANAGDTLTFRTTVGPDVVAPVVEKLAPTGDVVGAGGTVDVRVADNVGVTQVTFSLDGGAPSTATAVAGSPDTYRFDPSVLGADRETPFTLTVAAKDAKGNGVTVPFPLEWDPKAPEVRDVSVRENEARGEGVDPGARVTVTATITDLNMRNATVRVGPSEAPMALTGGNTWQTQNLRAPDAPGEYRIVVYAFDEGGNTVRVVEDRDVVRVKGIDLIVGPLVGQPTNPKAGDTVTLSALIQNRGVLPAAGVPVHLLVDGKVEAERVLTIGAGATQTAAFTWKATVGPHTFRIVVDPTNQFQETNEQNNVVQGASATVFPGARVFTKEAAESGFGDLLMRYLWVVLLGLATVAVGVVAFVMRPTP